MKKRLSPGFQTAIIDRKHLNPKSLQLEPIVIITEKPCTKYEGAAIIESWLKVDLKSVISAIQPKND